MPTGCGTKHHNLRLLEGSRRSVYKIEIEHVKNGSIAIIKIVCRKNFLVVFDDRREWTKPHYFLYFWIVIGKCR